eukprot:TRINITY_DN70752_c0_g1_i1.p5 TRINITY_DN70752_c0_g1~~TRINITY_DN70752_c0_g1_i1.p5  ORF type:complete len:105 (-),score=19.89 TRINITY_DN70752_c0_g1_i1:302-616(-)
MAGLAVELSGWGGPFPSERTPQQVPERVLRQDWQPLAQKGASRAPEQRKWTIWLQSPSLRLLAYLRLLGQPISVTTPVVQVICGPDGKPSLASLTYQLCQNPGS